MESQPQNPEFRNNLENFHLMHYAHAFRLVKQAFPIISQQTFPYMKYIHIKNDFRNNYQTQLPCKCICSIPIL